jgi:hypothetical protein
VVECLPSKHQGLEFKHYNCKKKKKKRRIRRKKKEKKIMPKVLLTESPREGLEMMWTNLRGR